MLSIIAAIGRKNELGKDNSLLWHLPEDLKRFKQITTGHPIIMGRKTFQSLPGILPDREHIVITRDSSFSVPDKRVKVVHSIEEALAIIDQEEENFVIGGGEIYRQLLPFAEKLYLTIIDEEFPEADTFFPEIDYGEWEVIEEIAGLVDDKSQLSYRWVDLNRKK
ncbi:MAG: dihydrofolate reductase [Halanaerobiaceae bacterium]|nr:dihydrofolate reductase [Halanaerobiaceae bacterium]